MVIVPLGKLSFAFFGGKVRFLKGERGKPIYWCMLFRTNSLLSFLVFFPFLSIFALIFFLLFLLCFSFLSRENILCFFSPCTGHGKGLLIVPAMTSILLFCPLTVFVWPGCTCRPCCATEIPCQTEADSFCPTVHRGLSCHDVNLLSLHTQSMHSTVPSQIASFGWSIIPVGRTSQKRFEQGPKMDLFPSPHHQTIPPFTSYL